MDATPMKQLALLFVLLFMGAAHAQPVGQLQSGQTWGNFSSGQGIAQPTLIGPLLDKGYTCTAQGSLMYRGGTFWTCLGPGTSGLPLVSQGAGANLHYAALGNAALTNSSVTIGSTAVSLGAAVTTFAGVTLTAPTINAGALSGTFSGTPTFSGVPVYSGLSVVSCTSGLGLDGSNNLVKVGCPGSASAIQPGTTTVTGGTLGKLLVVGAGPVLAQVAPQAIFASPGSTTQNNATTQLMFGFGGACAITPAFSGRVRVTFQGGVTVSATTVNRNLRFGTGSAPASGATASASGTALWTINLSINTASSTIPFSHMGVVTGLTIGTAYWFDVAGAGAAAGNDIISTPNCIVEEF